MSVPTGVPGNYPGPQPQQHNPAYGPPPGQPRPGHTPGSASNPFARMTLAQQLSLLVLVPALVAYICGFADVAGDLGLDIALLLTGGLLAALQLLPKAPRTLPIGTVLSVVGGLLTLLSVIQAGSGAALRVIILIFALIQAVLAVVALLMEYEVIKLAPRPAVPYGPPAGFPPPSAGFGHPMPPQGPQYGQPQQQYGQPQQPVQGQQYGQPQATQHFAPPQQPHEQPQQQAPHDQAAQQPPRMAPTAFMQQPGQITQPPAGGEGGSSEH